MNYMDAERLYNKAVENKDERVLNEFRKYGNDKRHMINNYGIYSQFLACGYKNAPCFDENGWCKNWKIELNKQHLTLWKDKYNDSYIEFAQLPNGKWIYGYSYMLSESGGVGGCSIFSDQYNSKNEAINEGLKLVESNIKHSKKAVDLAKLEIIQKMKVRLSWPSLF